METRLGRNLLGNLVPIFGLNVAGSRRGRVVRPGYHSSRIETLPPLSCHFLSEATEAVSIVNIKMTNL